MKEAMIHAFFDQLVKIAQGDELGAEALRQMTSGSMMPRRLSATERAMPALGTLAGSIGGTMGGGHLARSMGARGWRGALVSGVSGLAGGLSGLAAGKAGRESSFRNRQIEAAKKIMEMRRRIEGQR